MSTARTASALAIYAGRNEQNHGGSPAFVRLAETYCDDLGKRITDILPGTSITLCGVTTGPVGEHTASRDAFGVVLVARSPHPPGAILFQLPPPAIDAWLDRLLGGPGSSTEPRAVSEIDIGLSRILLDLAHKTFASVLSKRDIDLGLQFEAVVSAAAKIPALRQITGIATIEVALGAQNSAARFKILIPDELSARIGATISAATPAAELPAIDQGWMAQIEGHIARTEVPIEAVLETAILDLGVVASWHIGQTIPLLADRTTLIDLLSEDVPLARCEIGRNGDDLMLRVVAAHDPEAQFRNELTETLVRPGQG